MPTNSLRGIFYTQVSGQPLKEVSRYIRRQQGKWREMGRNGGKSCQMHLTAAKNNTLREQNENDFLSAKKYVYISSTLSLKRNIPWKVAFLLGKGVDR